MKLTAQVKLQPSPEQAEILLRTLEMANAAANRMSQIAWNAQEFGQYSLQRLGYRMIRDEFAFALSPVSLVVCKFNLQTLAAIIARCPLVMCLRLSFDDMMKATGSEKLYAEIPVFDLPWRRK